MVRCLVMHLRKFSHPLCLIINNNDPLSPLAHEPETVLALGANNEGGAGGGGGMMASLHEELWGTYWWLGIEPPRYDKNQCDVCVTILD